ncbi:MAG: hypothetical protein HG457_001320 [Flavobacteriaceae bacterium]|nr:hypothetical protein [Flavobacteriaceae bacterium]
METRIIDLIKNPETLRVEDLNLLETEIEKFPYMQSLRAIYLLGVHRFYNENFSKELAKTAAYTTDKRILYNLINKTNENMAAALAASAFPFKTDLAVKTPKIQEVKTEAIPAPAEVKIEENTDLVTEKQSVKISEPVSFVEENKNEEAQAVNNETPSIPDVSLVEEPQSDVLSPEKIETEKTELTAAEYIAAEMAKLKSGAATEEPAIAEKEENIEIAETIEIISEAEKEEILVEEVKAEEISPVEIVEEKEVEVEIEAEPVEEEERFSAEELASPDTFNLRKPKETTIDFYNRKQTGFVEETPAQKENKYSSEKPISEKPAEKEEEEEKETNISFYAQKQAESVEESPTQKEDFYSAKTTSESPAEKEERETTIDFYARKQTGFVEETSAQKEDFYSAKTTSESPAEKEERETTIDFYARKQTSFVEETPAQKENIYSSEETISESSTEKEAKETTIDFYASKKANSDAQEEQASYSPVNIYQKQIDTEKEDTAEVSKNLVQEENISTTEEAANSEKPEPKAEIETEKVSEAAKPTSNSNVTSFISTWKSWLKIDRSEIVTPSEQDKKAAIIDKFIENNPKISPIKEDVDFIVKEKSNDISHLMTETLAQLYVEQKLYTKAIQAYKILQEKHPEKTEEFEERIEEIKKSRNIK